MCSWPTCGAIPGRWPSIRRRIRRSRRSRSGRGSRTELPAAGPDAREKWGAVASGVLAEPRQRLGEDGGPVGVAAPLLHIGQVGLVRLAARRPGGVRLIAPGREPAPGAIPGLRHGRVAREARPGFMIVGAPEGDPHPRCRLATLRLAHGASADTAAPNGVATTHRPPLALSAALWPSVIKQQVEADDTEEPDDPGENGEPVQIPLHDGR